MFPLKLVIPQGLMFYSFLLLTIQRKMKNFWKRLYEIGLGATVSIALIVHGEALIHYLGGLNEEDVHYS
jgi:hypothetical protein